MKTIKPCNKICKECGFIKGGATDTLYAETAEMVHQGILFPCHMELKAISGDESYGVEQMDDVRVCRGYVAFMRLNYPDLANLSVVWKDMMNEITNEELAITYTTNGLIANHKPLREGIRLGNNEGLV